MIAILDYGIGNLMSVRKALHKLGCPSDVTKDPGLVSQADALILPGVGAFGEAMGFLHSSGLIKAVMEFIHSGRPVLGICLGMQILFERSEESPWATGLSAIRGTVKRFNFAEGFSHASGRPPKVPHMGWNQVEIKKTNGLSESIPDGSYFYFAHSFYAVPEDPEVEIGRTIYGYHAFPSVVAAGNTFGVQFHPEKSGDVGLALLENFVNMCN